MSYGICNLKSCYRGYGYTVSRLGLSITRYPALAETPPPEPGQKSAYKENNDGAINKEKLNRQKGEPHT